MKNQVLIAALCAAVSGSVVAQKQNWEWVADVGDASFVGLRNEPVSPYKPQPFGVYTSTRHQWGLIFANGKKTPAIFRAGEFEENFFGPSPVFHEGMAAIKEYGSDLYGFVDDQGNIAIAPRFYQVGFFSEGLAPARESNGGLVGYIDKKGNWVIPPSFACDWMRMYDFIHFSHEGWANGRNEFSEGLAAQKDPATKKMGYIDRSGKWVIQPQYDEAEAFSQGLAGVTQNGLSGAIDKTGKVVIPIKHKFRIFQFNPEGWALTCADCAYIEAGVWGTIDKMGNVLVTPQFKLKERQPNGWYRIEKGGRYGFLNSNGRVGIPAQYLGVDAFSEGLLMVKTKEKTNKLGWWITATGFVDETGKMVIPDKFCSFSTTSTPSKRFSEGFAAAADYDLPEESCYGYIDKKGNWLVRPQFKSAESFSEGFGAVVYPDGRCALVDNTGKIIPLDQIQNIQPFHEGLAAAASKTNGKWGAIDKTGQFAIPPTFDKLLLFKNGFALAQVGDKWGMINKTGQFAISPIFDKLDNFAHGVAHAELGGKSGLIRYTGTK